MNQVKTHLPINQDTAFRGQGEHCESDVARIISSSPDAESILNDVDQTVANIRALRRRVDKLSLTDILSYRQEGHKA